MSTASQSEIRLWARAQGMHVNDRGSLPAVVTAAYAATSSTPKGTIHMATVAKRPGRKSAAPARKRTAATKATAKASAAPRAKATGRARAAAKATAARPAVPAATLAADAPAAGSIDLAGGLRSYLDSVKVEVLAVSALSEQIDELVAALNAAREEKATRLLVLDDLRDAFSDAGQYGFLDQLIKPRKTRVPEVVPARLEVE
ncbi:MAG: hypothetical protein JWM22_2827 [Frankiales bacterium]|nr:hypothetical protein [Frankiales bacterium]